MIINHKYQLQSFDLWLCHRLACMPRCINIVDRSQRSYFHFPPILISCHCFTIDKQRCWQYCVRVELTLGLANSRAMNCWKLSLAHIPREQIQCVWYLTTQCRERASLQLLQHFKINFPTRTWHLRVFLLKIFAIVSLFCCWGNFLEDIFVSHYWNIWPIDWIIAHQYWFVSVKHCLCDIVCRNCPRLV